MPALFPFGEGGSPTGESDSEAGESLPQIIEEREDSPGAEDGDDTSRGQGGVDSELETRQPGNSNKRKLSPTTTPSSPAPLHLDSSVASSPILLPHTAQLPPSNFTFHTTRSHPVNKNNFRYTACGPSGTCNLPIVIQRSIESPPQSVRFSWEDRSSFVLITEDAKTITAEKGWRAARGNVGVREGNWFWEVKVERGGGEGGRATGGSGEGSWVRAGVGRRESPLNAPVGFDGHSYAYQDKNGESVTLARRTPYGAPYTSGSTLGIYISLPPRPLPSTTDRRDPARIVRKRIPIRYKGQLYFESLEYGASKEMEDLSVDPANKAKLIVEEKKAAAPGMKARPQVAELTPPPRVLPILEGAKIAFFLDGVCQGVAFEDIYDFLPLRLHPGTRERRRNTDAHLKVMENSHDDGATGYFPFVSVFGGGIATLNPGPDFDFPPPDDIERCLKESGKPPGKPGVVQREREGDNRQWRPLCERYPEFLVEQAALDDKDELEATKVYLAAQEAEAASLASESDQPLKKGKPSFSSTYTPTVARLASLGVVMLPRKDEPPDEIKPVPVPTATTTSQATTPAPEKPKVIKKILGESVIPTIVERKDSEPPVAVVEEDLFRWTGTRRNA